MKLKGFMFFVVIMVFFALIIAVLIYIYPMLNRSLLTQVIPGLEEEEQVLEKKIRLTIPEDTEPGTYKFRVEWEDSQDESLLALVEEITIIVGDGGSSDNGGNDNSGSDSGGGDEGGGDNGGDGGGGGEEEPARPVKAHTFAPHTGHVISGAYSGIRNDSGLTVATLAHSGARLAKKVVVSSDSYWLYVNVKHDRPGPVDMAVYLNDRAWKVIRLDKNDDRYWTHRVGLLRNFSGGTIRFRFLNDVYDKSDPTNEAKDRNLHIASWGLTTDASRLPLAKTVSRSVGGRATSGIVLLPGLNQVIREELGRQFVTLDIWKYYAVRLTASPKARESIRSEEQLRNVMQFWKGVRPSRPRGD
jgi:hypothetical protein